MIQKFYKPLALVATGRVISVIVRKIVVVLLGIVLALCMGRITDLMIIGKPDLLDFLGPAGKAVVDVIVGVASGALYAVWDWPKTRTRA